MKKLIKFLEENKVKYEKIFHRKVYTAYDKAQTLKVPEKLVGKTLVLKFGPKNFAIMLIPSNRNLSLEKLKKVAKVKQAQFVKEAWMKKNLKGVKVGAVPPFGNLWGLATFIDKTLLSQPKIIVNGGDYNFSIELETKTLKQVIPNLVSGSFSQAKK